MSTRYVWDVYNVAYGEKQTEEKNIYEVFLPSGSYDGAFYFSTGIKKESNGSYSLSGTVLNAINMDHASSEQYVYKNADQYMYGAQKKTGNTSYIENTTYLGSATSYWCFQVYMKSGESKHRGRVVLREYPYSASPEYTFQAHELSEVKGPTKIKTLSSGANNTYPQDGVFGSSWYDYKGSDSIDPLSVTYSNNKPERGEAVTVTVDAPANTLGGTVSYLYQYSTNGGLSWTTDGAATTEKQKQITVPDGSEQFMARVRAQDDIGFTSADYVSGENLTVQTMNLWVGVNGEAKRVRKLWVGVNGVAHPVVRGWVGDENGVARRWF